MSGKDNNSRKLRNNLFRLLFSICIVTCTIPNDGNDSFAGNEIKDYGIVDGWKNYYTIDTNNPVKEDGIIANFEIFARAVNPLKLLIYRGKGKDMKMVAESKLQFPIRKGKNSFTIAPIIVKKGDYLGFFNKDGGTVAFKLLDGKFSLGDKNFSGSAIFTKQNDGPNQLYSSSNRVYAIRAKVLSKNDKKDSFAGNEIKDYGLVDSSHNFYLVDTNNPIKEDGIISNFEVFARALNPIKLLIYRGKGKDKKMIAESKLQFCVRKGKNSFTIKPIPVKKGDYLGFFNKNGGTVAFKLNDSTWTLGLGNFSGTVFQTSQKDGPNKFFTSTNRVYAIRANVLSYEKFFKSIFQ